MIRIFLSLCGFLVLTILQLSLIPSLPWIFSAIPLMIAGSTYLVQHLSVADGAWWLVAFGLSLDIFGIGLAPLETISFSLAAIVTIIGAKHFFSNRSLYGIIGSAITALFVIAISQTIILTFVWLRNPELVEWSTNWTYYQQTALTLIIPSIFLFSFARRAHQSVLRMFLLSNSERRTS